MAAQAGGAYGRGNFRYTSYFKQRTTQILEAQERAAYRTGEWAAEQAQDLAPVDTGELRGSISFVVRKTQRSFAIVVYAGASYAGYVELGTINMQAQPFLRPVLDKINKQFGLFLQEEVRKVAA